VVRLARSSTGYRNMVPIGAQPAGRRGTVDRPYSALNLRLVLAALGLISSAVLALVSFGVGLDALGWVLLLLAVVAVVDLVVVQLRRRARRRTEGGHSSLFE
jgi:membrane protein YdbS with pleckstrin-like domain